MCSTNQTITIDLDIRTFHSVASIILGVLGTIGNMISVTLICRKKLYRTGPTMMMVIDLCVANLISTILILPMIAINSFHDQWLFGEATCQAFAYTMYVAITTECLILMDINISQYLVIVHQITLDRNKAGILISLLVLPWVIALAIYIIPLSRLWDKFEYDPRRGYCSITNTRGENSFQSVLSMTFIAIISVVTIYCYSAIFYVHTKSRRKTSSSLHEAAARFRGQARNAQLVKMITAILFNYCLTYLPYLLTNVIDPCGSRIPQIIYTAVIYVSWSHTATNPLIYALMNTKIKALWKGLLLCMQRQDSNRKSPEAGNGGRQTNQCTISNTVAHTVL